MSTSERSTATEQEVVFDANTVRSWLSMPNYAMNNMTIPEFKALCRAALRAAPQSSDTPFSETAPQPITESMIAAAKKAEPKVGRDAIVRIYGAMQQAEPATRSVAEECAKVADEMDCAMLCGVGHEVGDRIRALASRLPERATLPEGWVAVPMEATEQMISDGEMSYLVQAYPGVSDFSSSPLVASGISQSLLCHARRRALSSQRGEAEMSTYTWRDQLDDAEHSPSSQPVNAAGQAGGSSPRPRQVGTPAPAAPSTAAPHIDHPLRHWDRTCPACIAEAAASETTPTEKCRIERLERRCTEAVGRWIPLRERLPEGNGDVLAYHAALGPHGHGVIIRPIDVVRHWAIHKDDQSMIDAYWMPLPSAPEGKA